MDDTDIGVLSEDGSDIPDGESTTLDYKRFPDLYLMNSSIGSSDYPASLHALNTAYDDLKKRYNELQTRHRVVLRQLKRSSAPPELQSPSSTYTYKVTDHIQNGDISSWSSRGSENSTTAQLENLVFEAQEENKKLNHEIQKLSLELEEKKKQCVQFAERVQLIPSLHTQHQNSMKAANERQLLLEEENEALRKELITVQRKLKEALKVNEELRQIKETDSDHLSLTSESLADTLSFMKLEEDSAPLQSREGEVSLSSDLEPLLHGVIQFQREIIQLKDMVAKQRQVIQLLKSRQNVMKNGQTVPAGGQGHSDLINGSQGARPKVRTGSSSGIHQQIREKPLQSNGIHTEPLLSGAAIPDASRSADFRTEKRTVLRESGSESALNDLYRNKEVKLRESRSSRSPSHQTHLKDLLSPVNTSLAGDVDISAIQDIRDGATRKRHSAFDAYPPKSSTTDGFWQDKRHSTSGIARDMDKTDPLCARLSRGIHGAPNMENIRDLVDIPKLPAGFHGRNDSLEHLHDDTPLEQNLDDVIIEEHHSVSTASSPELYETLQDLDQFTSRGLSESEVALVTKDNTQRITEDGTIENRYRNSCSDGQPPRPISIERNDCDRNASSDPGYNNTSNNVNLNYQSTNKNKLTMDSGESYQVLNNDPLVGHKTIPRRNIYDELQEESAGDNARLTSQGRARIETMMSRVCPVCEEDFGYLIPMEDFQHHVLDCLAVPNPGDSPTPQDRVCPMCSAVFPSSIMQRDFEMHVNEHFEDDTRPVVNEFEVVPKP